MRTNPICGRSLPSARFLLVAGVVFAARTVALSGAEPAAADFYVSPEGSDQWSGTLPQPGTDGKDGPFATPDRARDAVRRLRAEQTLRRPVTVMLREGVYRREAPIVLGPGDSGMPESPVIYQSYPGERAVISGGRPITGWKPGPAGVWTVELPDVKSGAAAFRQLFVNDLDEHSLVADPLFVDPDNGDFSLKPESPAWKLGFQPIDLSRVGPRE